MWQSIFEKKKILSQSLLSYIFQNTVDPFTFALIMGDQEDKSNLQGYYQTAKSFFATKQSNTYQRQAENR